MSNQTMDLPSILTTAQTALTPFSDVFINPEAKRLDIVLPAEKLTAAARALLDLGFYLSAITGMDLPPTDQREGQIELLYHFCKGPAVVTLRVPVPYSLPNAPTLCNLIPSATLYERELIEMFGVHLEGTPSTAKLLLPDDWPDGVYPLRKSFTGLEKS